MTIKPERGELNFLPTLKAIEEFLWDRAQFVIEESKEDHPPIILTWADRQCECYMLGPLMDDKPKIGELFTRLVNTPGYDFVVQIGQGYVLHADLKDLALARRYRLNRLSGKPLSDMPEAKEVVFGSIYDKTKRQCECWSFQWDVKDHKLTRSEPKQIEDSMGQMSAPIPRKAF